MTRVSWDHRLILRTSAVLLVVGLLAVMWAPTARADTYTYTGPTFNSEQLFDGAESNPCYGVPSCSDPLTNISGSFTLIGGITGVTTSGGALEGGLSEVNLLADVSSWSFTDGNVTISNTSPGLQSATAIYVSTNSAGVITSWYINIEDAPASGGVSSISGDIGTDALFTSNWPSSCGDSTEWTTLSGDYLGEDLVDCNPTTGLSAGTWTTSTTTTPPPPPVGTPEPSSLLLLACGLVGVSLLGRKKLLCGQAAKAV